MHHMLFSYNLTSSEVNFDRSFFFQSSCYVQQLFAAISSDIRRQLRFPAHYGREISLPSLSSRKRNLLHYRICRFTEPSAFFHPAPRRRRHDGRRLPPPPCPLSPPLAFFFFFFFGHGTLYIIDGDGREPLHQTSAKRERWIEGKKSLRGCA